MVNPVPRCRLLHQLAWFQNIMAFTMEHDGADDKILGRTAQKHVRCGYEIGCGALEGCLSSGNALELTFVAGDRFHSTLKALGRQRKKTCDSGAAENGFAAVLPC